MIWIAYNILFTIGYLALLPYFLFRMLRRGGYSKGFLQRFAIMDSRLMTEIGERRRIWVHAVSVGEILVALRYIEELRKCLPGIAFVLTTTTSTGHAIAQKRKHSEDVLIYFPADFPWIIRRALRIIRPLAIILVEGELWPNLIRLADKRGIPVVLVNGRISDRSARGYAILGCFFRRGINLLRHIFVQNDHDRTRLLDLGADDRIVKVMGSAKYDVCSIDPASSEQQARSLLHAAGISDDDVVIVGGSTWPGEERALLEVYKTLKPTCPDVRLVLVPRHAERAAKVSAEIECHALGFVRRSSLTGAAAPVTQNVGKVLLVDTTGELAGFYACATIIFVGKSLTCHGGQNIIEPALCGKPIVVGPHTENFSTVAADFLAADAMVQVADEAGLKDAIQRLAADRRLCEAYGMRAREVVTRKTGAIRATVQLLMPCLMPQN